MEGLAGDPEGESGCGGRGEGAGAVGCWAALPAGRGGGCALRGAGADREWVEGEGGGGAVGEGSGSF